MPTCEDATMVISHIRCFSALATLLAGPLFFLDGPVAAQTASPPVILINSGSTTAPDGSTYILDSVMVPVINASGQIAFRASLVTTSSPTGIIAGTPGSLQIVARVGDAAPSGGNYNVLNDPIFNSNGQVAFVANTSGNGNGQFARTLGFPTTTAALVGTASPTGNNYSALNALPVVNASGQVAFLANLAGAATQGIFAGTPGTTLATAALLGNAAPAGGNYQQLTNPAINSAGKVLFRASLTGGTAGSGVFYGTPGTTLPTVALQGTASPAGGNYGNFSGTPAVNSAGQVAIISDVGSSNNGIFA